LILEDLSLQSFRNLNKENFRFSAKKNLIHGMNGVGKTSVLEAIFLMGFGRSFLNIKKSDMIQFTHNQFMVRSVVASQFGKNDLSAIYDKQFGLFVNDKKSGLVEMNKYLFPVYFSSANYNLQVESKPHLRKMINRFIFGVHPLYMHYILCYNKALKQKNYLLKNRKNQTELSCWNKIMSEMAEKIMETRFNFIDTLNKEIKNRFNNDLEVEYRPSLKTPCPPIKDRIYQELEQIKARETQNCQSQIGPHLDNYHLKRSGKNLKFYSSGEKKINLLMIYIAFIEIFKNTKDEYPVFMVDDFDSAIDNRNINFLINNYPDMQIIATSVKKNNQFDRLIELKKEN